MTYGKRLNEAMEIAGKTRADLAKALGTSPQAIGQCIRGDTGALTAENSAKAAACCAVDHYWLATGQGKPRPELAWPFELFDNDDYMRVSAEYRARIENELAGEIMRLKKRSNGTDG
jgi:transcriptional regulator with XRE-family HTH domain